MAETIVKLTSPDGASSEVSADVTLYNNRQRVVRATAFVIVGLLAVTGCLLVPGPHMLLFWVGPLVGILVARKALKTHAKVFDITGPCPQCEERIEINGGAIGAEPAAYPCPKCKAELTLDVPAA